MSGENPHFGLARCQCKLSMILHTGCPMMENGKVVAETTSQEPVIEMSETVVARVKSLPTLTEVVR